MSVRIKPNPDQLKQLLRCAQIDGEKMADLVIHLGKLENPPLLPDQLLKVVKSQIDEENAEILLSQVLSLSMLVRTSESKSVDVIKALRIAFEVPEQQAQWDSIALSIQGLIDSTPVRLVTKAMELSYDYANLLKRARILTDLRPLFDEEGETVEGGVVTHTLRIAYASDNGRHELSLALDLQDVKKLREQCDRAIVKATSIRDEFVESTKKPCLISGEMEENNG